MSRPVEIVVPGRRGPSTSRKGMLAPLLAAAVLAAGCAGPAPSGEGDPTLTAPAGTGEPFATRTPVPPSAAATATADITVAWEEAVEPRASGGFLEALVHGERGWVGISDCNAGRCGPIDDGLVAWRSTDARTWSAQPFPAVAGERLVFRHLAAGAGGYVATTEDFSQRFPNRMEELWASSDGADWRVVGDIDIVGCTRRLCPLVRSLAVAPTGGMLLHLRDEREEQSFGPYVSDDGVEWRLVKAAAFGLDDLVVDSIRSTDAAALLMGRPCWGCAPRLWTSTDGATWDPVEEATLQADPLTWPSLATGDGRTVIGVYACPAAPPCGSQLWSTTDGESWTRGIAVPHVGYAPVTFTGSAFVAVGLHSGCTEYGAYLCQYVVLASADGETWTEMSHETPMNPADAECPIEWSAGGAGKVLFGSADCFNWRGTVEVP